MRRSRFPFFYFCGLCEKLLLNRSPDSLVYDPGGGAPVATATNAVRFCTPGLIGSLFPPPPCQRAAPPLTSCKPSSPPSSPVSSVHLNLRRDAFSPSFCGDRISDLGRFVNSPGLRRETHFQKDCPNFKSRFRPVPFFISGRFISLIFFVER